MIESISLSSNLPQNTPSTLVRKNNEEADIKNIILLDFTEKKDDIKKELKENIEIKPENIIISNSKFGYNQESKDFYIKVMRGNIENQYPSEDMMKMKIYLKNELKD